MTASASFLQSPEWQEIQERMGRPTARIGSMLLVRHDFPFGFHCWYSPRPAPDAAGLQAAFFRARASGAIFLKIDPAEELPTASFRNAPSHSLQPSVTLRIDCKRPDAELLAAMHPKTRYNIRLAERYGVAVRAVESSAEPGALAAFLRISAETARREGFRLHPAGYYRLLLDVKSGEFTNVLFLAEWQGAPVAAAVANFYRPAGTATYLHGGSSRAERAVMAPQLLHWRMIQYARAQDFGAYDFGGIDERRWPGVTRFKRGFGGTSVEFPPSVDFVFRPAHYTLYRFQRRLRRLP